MATQNNSYLFMKRNDAQSSAGCYWYAMVTGILMPRMDGSSKYTGSDYFNAVT
ncbi:hypothetical protein LZZ85_06655 [Terrimonas sp. NA20]|uniref:Uncharacterized protein n=1 Tax=Terrimonas ginsenosidimutans TaxID=2908004 RepID=A0ABS9KNP6_9BACT|nr:hypothetical protein [Terrimonas ginsenosidimutans]MCG2613953.1 hypothetical protein [Terrimonas ginsenosidimutans]